jgi:hypothetical protein
MQMGFDFQDGSQGSIPLAETGIFAGPWAPRARPVPDGLVPGRPDWAGLKARFAALHALRRTIDSATGALVPAGSFRAAAEATLASARGQGDIVNRLCSGNGKAPGGMVAMLSPTVPRAATEDSDD